MPILNSRIKQRQRTKKKLNREQTKKKSFDESKFLSSLLNEIYVDEYEAEKKYFAKICGQISFI